MVTKKRSDDAGKSSGPVKRTTKSTTKSTSSVRSDKPAPKKRAVEAAVSAASKKAARPKLRASHANAGEGATRRKTIGRSKGPAPVAARGPAVRKAPLATPKRTQPRNKAVPETPSAARQLALDIVAGGLEKKALNCEVIDVRGRVDYADFLVIMTGRSDRHVSSIAHGIEEELGKKKIAAISIEGMTASTWVLLDYGDVVVHVFQEDARQLYDIEGLWMDAGRLPVAAEEGQTAARAAAPVEADDEDADDEDADDEDADDEDADDEDADDEDADDEDADDEDADDDE